MEFEPFTFRSSVSQIGGVGRIYAVGWLQRYHIDHQICFMFD